MSPTFRWTGFPGSRLPGWGAGPEKQYRISRNRPISEEILDGTDIWALKNNYISITPLHIGLGYPEQIPEVEDLLAGVSAQLLDRLD